MHLVVGLGNPGPGYARTRHNVGFLVIDTLAGRCRLDLRARGELAETAEGVLAGRRIVLAKPLTYMNLSGNAVGPLCRRYRVEIPEVLVAHDDLDLPLGTVRVRGGGGSGGHRGVESVVTALGDAGFVRIRVGVGRPPEGEDPAEYLLRPFTPAEAVLLPEVIDRAAAAAQTVIAEGTAAAMNRFNVRRPPVGAGPSGR